MPHQALSRVVKAQSPQRKDTWVPAGVTHLYPALRCIVLLPGVGLHSAAQLPVAGLASSTLPFLLDVRLHKLHIYYVRFGTGVPLLHLSPSHPHHLP